MKRYIKNRKAGRKYYLNIEGKYKILWAILVLFMIFSVYFLDSGKAVNHDQGAVSADLTQMNNPG
ncbi:hypothetical protein [Blautia sp. MSJ-19]|uniref:hypothetical protein n=1 Tax=Blautia sp. MSJ-19 TaxID=2841517 RepID=UPI001C0F221B|nr:hypothetical protein [Blautia sp. MSJ-19]MBU5480153.1 hypothetical protein [Blautia sp. MSJ-19]